MNYITACPACETQFLLTKAHLKAYRGKVECGNCHHVFNAKNRLTEVSDDLTSAEHATAELNSTENSVNLATNTEAFDAPDTITEAVTIDHVEPTHAVDEKPINKALNVVLDTVPNLSDLGVNNVLSNQQRIPIVTSNSEDLIAEQDVDIDAVRAPIFIDDLTTDPKFQLSKPKRKVWLSVAVLLLILLALLQSAYFLRSTIAAYYPPIKPVLDQACRYLNCAVQLPRHLDLLTIDDSDMQENDDYQNVINFSSLLINNAPHVQAYPNIELTLTDVDDKPVLRKLVKPQAYLTGDIEIENGLSAGQQVRINLAINVQNLSVAGYRVLLTY